MNSTHDDEGISSALTRRAVLRGAVAGAGLFALGLGTPGAAATQSLVPGRTLRLGTRITSAAGTIGGSVSADSLEVPRGEILRFDPSRDTTLEMTGNLVVNGRLEMRPQAGVEHVIRFVGVDESVFVGGGLEVLESDVGLWVMGNGVLDLRGTRKQAWNRTGDSRSWGRHDELVVAPVAPGDFQPHPFRKGAAVPTFGERRAEVLNLTRNVRIEGTPGGRAHVFIRSTKPQSIRYAEFRHLGPRQPSDNFTDGVLGRYPLHFHHCMDGSRGSVVQGVVVRDSGSHAFVPHMSHGITMRSCIAYEIFDAAYWWDPDEITNDLEIKRCVAASVHHDPEFRGFRLPGFFLGLGEGLRLRQCVAFSIQGGKHACGYVWPEAPSGLWDFTDNSAHNNLEDGIFVWQNNREPHLIERFTAYNNGNSGISHGAYGNAYHYRDLDLRDQPNSIILHAGGREDFSGQPMSWIDVQGTNLLVTAHNLPAGATALFLRCAFPGGVTLDDAAGDPAPLDFVDCGLQPENFSVISLNPDTVIRVQNSNGSAFQLSANGVTDIPSFYP